MKAKEFINEFKIVKTNFAFKIYQNPSKIEFKSLLKKIKALRGIIDGKNLYVWNANDLIHDSVIDELQLKNPISLFFAKTLDDADEWYSFVSEINGIWVASEPSRGLKHPMVQKVLGIKNN